MAFWVLSSITLLILISIQGLFNGDNFLDSIIFGFLIGVEIAIFSHFLMRPLLDAHIEKLMDGMYVTRY